FIFARNGTSPEATGVKFLQRRTGTMFAETLLDSSPLGRKRKRWPMATAFTVETLIAAVVVIVPLLSTGVIPLSARVQIPAPTKKVRLEPMKRVRAQPSSSSSPAEPVSRPAVVPIVDRKDSIYIGPRQSRLRENEDPLLDNPGPEKGNAIGEIIRGDKDH